MTMNVCRDRISVLTASLLLCTVMSQSASSQDPATFFAGKTVSLYVGYPPGGGYDVYARAMAPFLVRNIPGQPTIVVRNVPGAASLVLANQLYSTLPQDGTAIGTFARSIAMDKLMGRESTNFEPTKFNWIGSANSEVSLCAVWHGLNIKSIDDFLSREIMFGGNAPGSESDSYPKILNNILGTKFKVTTGYPSGSDLMLAMERGETQGRCGFTWSAAKTSHGDWIRDKKMYIAIQFAVARHPELPDVPVVTELARTPEQRAALELILVQQAMGRPYAAPPNVPADRVTALRNAFDLTMRDKEFLADASKRRMEIQPISGSELEKLVRNMFSASAETVAMARRALGK